MAGCSPWALYISDMIFESLVLLPTSVIAYYAFKLADIEQQGIEVILVIASFNLPLLVKVFAKYDKLKWLGIFGAYCIFGGNLTLFQGLGLDLYSGDIDGFNS
jgi:hypothetical protein